MMQFDNNLLSILSFASTRSTWVSVSSCAEKCGIDYNLVWKYLTHDSFVQVADFFRYDYVIRRRHQGFYLSAVSRGYA